MFVQHKLKQHSFLDCGISNTHPSNTTHQQSFEKKLFMENYSQPVIFALETIKIKKNITPRLTSPLMLAVAMPFSLQRQDMLF